MEENRKIKILKSIFGWAISFNLSDDGYIELAKMCNTTEDKVRICVKKYYDNYASIDEKIKYESIIARKGKGGNNHPALTNSNPLYAPIFEQLLASKSDKERIKILDSVEINHRRSLKSSITSYISRIESNYDSKELQRIKLELQSIINSYKKLISKRGLVKHKKALRDKHQEKLNEMKVVLNAAADSLFQTSKDFCKSNNIDHNEFVHMSKSVCSFDKKTYSIYCSKMLKKMSITSLGNENIQLLIDHLVNGITYNNQTYPFNMLDYYMHTKVDIDELIDMFRNNNEVKITSLLIKFHQANKNTELLDPVIELNMYDKITIDDRTYNVTKAQKKAAIAYLKENNIPLYKNVYRLLLKRMLLTKSKTYSKKV